MHNQLIQPGKTIESAPKIIATSGLFTLVSTFFSGVLMMQQAEVFQGGYLSVEAIVFTALSLPLVLGVCLLSPLAAPVFQRTPMLLAYSLALILGGLVGFLWAFIPLLCLYNPYFGTGTFSFPFFFAWRIGGASGLLVTASISQSRSIWVPIGITIMLCLVIGLNGITILNWVRGERKISVSFIRWHPGSTPLKVDRYTQESLTESELALLTQSGLGGYTTEEGLGMTVGPEHVPYSRVIILMHEPIDDVEYLAVPEKGSVIYAQTDQGWQMFPPDAPLAQEEFKIRLEQEANYTMYWIDPYHIGGGAIQWRP